MSQWLPFGVVLMVLGVVVGGGVWIYPRIAHRWPALSAGDSAANDAALRELAPGLESPVIKDGSVDYLASVNQLASKNVTPEQNAVVPLARLLGTAASNAASHAQFEQLLGVNGLHESPSSALVLTSRFASEARNAGIASQFKTMQDQDENPNAYPQINSWLARCESDLDQVRAAADLPGFYLPYVATSDDDRPLYCRLISTELEFLQPLRQAVSALVARATLRWAEGEIDAALADLRGALILARRLQQQHFLMEWLVGISLEQTALRSVKGAMYQTQLPADRIDDVVRLLNTLPEPASAARFLDRTERWSQLDAAAEVKIHGWVVLGYIMELAAENTQTQPRVYRAFDASQYDWRLVAVELNAWQDRELAVLKCSTVSETDRQHNALQSEVRKSGQEFHAIPIGETERRSRALGAMIHSMLDPFTGALRTAEARRDVDLSILLAAIKLYQRKLSDGRYPPTIDELRAAVDWPIDPFTDSELHMSQTPSSIRIYSLGANRVDDGGPFGSRDDTGVALAN